MVAGDIGGEIHLQMLPRPHVHPRRNRVAGSRYDQAIDAGRDLLKTEASIGIGRHPVCSRKENGVAGDGSTGADVPKHAGNGCGGRSSAAGGGGCCGEGRKGRKEQNDRKDPKKEAGGDDDPGKGFHAPMIAHGTHDRISG
jgi:hypothetical protein